MALPLTTVGQMHDACLAAGVAVTQIRLRDQALLASVEIEPVALTAAAHAVLDGMDWSDAAQANRAADQIPERKTLRQAAAAAISDNDAFLANGSPNNAQVLAQVRKLTQQNTAIIRRLVQVD